MLIKKSKFLDRCEICHQPRICKGYKGLVLCDDCISNYEHIKETNETKDSIKDKKEITIFDFI